MWMAQHECVPCTSKVPGEEAPAYSISNKEVSDIYRSAYVPWLDHRRVWRAKSRSRRRQCKRSKTRSILSHELVDAFVQNTYHLFIGLDGLCSDVAFGPERSRFFMQIGSPVGTLLQSHSGPKPVALCRDDPTRAKAQMQINPRASTMPVTSARVGFQ